MYGSTLSDTALGCAGRGWREKLQGLNMSMKWYESDINQMVIKVCHKGQKNQIDDKMFSLSDATSGQVFFSTGVQKLCTNSKALKGQTDIIPHHQQEDICDSTYLKLESYYINQDFPQPSINQAVQCVSIYQQIFRFIVVLPNLHLLMQRADHTFPASVCLEGSVRHSLEMFLRWHHVMTQKPALTRKAVLKLHSVPEDEMCCGGESILSDFENSREWLSDVFWHQRGVLPMTVCVLGVLHIFLQFYPRLSQACCCCIVSFSLSMPLTSPPCIYDTPEWRSFLGKAPGTLKEREMLEVWWAIMLV